MSSSTQTQQQQEQGLERSYTSAKERARLDFQKNGLQSEAAQGNCQTVLERLLKLDERVLEKDLAIVYKKALLRFHPDRHVGKPAAKRASYEERFKLVRLAWDNHVARKVGNVITTSEEGEILEKAEIFDIKQVQRMIAMRKAREAAQKRFEKELRRNNNDDDRNYENDAEDDANEKVRKKQMRKTRAEARGKLRDPKSLESIARRLAKAEILKQRGIEIGRDSDTESYGTSTSEDEEKNSADDTESDDDELARRFDKEEHDKLLKEQVFALKKSEKVKVTVATKLLRLFNRSKSAAEDGEHRVRIK